MNEATPAIDDDDRRLLLAHYPFYRSLDSGKRTPTTPAQRHFVAVCRGYVSPGTDHERAYLRFKRACAAIGVNEADVVRAGFILLVESDPEDDAEIDVPVRRCAGCGRPIPPERLEVVSEATRCVTCQQQTEATSSNPQVSQVECPRCAAKGMRSRLVWRTARDPNIPGYFLGCSRFPECRYVDRS